MIPTAGVVALVWIGAGLIAAALFGRIVQRPKQRAGWWLSFSPLLLAVAIVALILLAGCEGQCQRDGGRLTLTGESVVKVGDGSITFSHYQCVSERATK